MKIILIKMWHDLLRIIMAVAKGLGLTGRWK